MPIPELLPEGWLPDGVHECTLDEVVEHFGRFQESDRRPRLARQLADYLLELRSAQIGKYLIVDGSFITSKPDPGDIDLLLVLRDDVELGESVPPFQYNPRSRSYIRRHFEFDFAFGFDDDPTSAKYFELYRKVKEHPGEVKGVLKVVL